MIFLLMLIIWQKTVASWTPWLTSRCRPFVTVQSTRELVIGSVELTGILTLILLVNLMVDVLLIVRQSAFPRTIPTELITVGG